MKISLKKLHEGEKIPFGYGIAWWDWNGRVAVIMPIPFHIICALIRIAYYRLVIFSFKYKREKFYNKIWQEGYERGRKEAFHQMELALKNDEKYYK